MSLVATARTRLFPQACAVCSASRAPRQKFVIQSRQIGQQRLFKKVKKSGNPDEAKSTKRKTYTEEQLAKSSIFTPRPQLDAPTISSIQSSHVAKSFLFAKGDDSLIKNYGVPRNVWMDFHLLSEQCSVIRQSATDLVAYLEKEAKSSARTVLTGTVGCGKSYVLLQAASHCAANGWIVLYTPRASCFVNSSSKYVYDPQSQTYHQPTDASQMLKRMAAVNAEALGSIKVAKDYPALEKRPAVSRGTPLMDVIEQGVQNTNVAVPLLSLVFRELGAQEQRPVLLAVDDLQSLYCTKTLYKDHHFRSIHPQHLSMPRLLMEYASGKRAFKRGAFLGAISARNSQFPLPLELSEALDLLPKQRVSPYIERSSDLVEYCTGLKAWPVAERLTFKEATTLSELYQQRNILHTDFTDEFFLSKLTESAGNCEAFVRGGLLGSQTSC